MKALAIALFFLGNHVAHAAPPTLAQSIPSETPLAHPGIPFAKDVWIEMISQAKKSIDLAQFYSSSKPGEALDSVISALEAAGARGVKIRFLISQELLKSYRPTFERIQKIPGIETSIFDISKLNGGILHAKYWIVDRKEIYVGSQNFDWRSLTEIHELGIRVQEPKMVRDLQTIFDHDWKMARSGKYKLKETRPEKISEKCISHLVASPASLNPTGIPSAELELLHLISKAKTRIRVQLLNYTTMEKGSKTYWSTVDKALREAATRGVKVELLVSDWNLDSPKIESVRSLAEIPNVEIKIAVIPASSKGPVPFARVIHSKYMTIDQSVFWIGTSNWGEDYFRNSRNVELVFCQDDLVQTGNQIFEKLWNSPYATDVHRVTGKSSIYTKE